MKRLVKTPKLHIGDPGLACALLGTNADALWSDRALFARLLETLVYQELSRLASWQADTVAFYHLRNKDQVESDIVMERAGRIAGVEVKAASTVRGGDFAGLRKLMDAAPDRFSAGVVFYEGDAVAGFGDRLFAVPLTHL